MRRTFWISLLACALLSAAGCSSPPPDAGAPVSLAAPSKVAPPAPAPPPGAVAPPSAAELGLAAPPSALGSGQLAGLEPSEIRVMMVDLNLAHALDLCGFPALGAFIRDYAQKTIDYCPNSAERKAAFRSLLQSARLREQRLDDEARAQGTLPRCYQPDRLQAIKEMVPMAQRLVAIADRPIECASISRAER
ncbi:MAG TPA: hypothetical protein VF502_09960 [Stellaceae bacterium]